MKKQQANDALINLLQAAKVFEEAHRVFSDDTGVAISVGFDIWSAPRIQVTSLDPFNVIIKRKEEFNSCPAKWWRYVETQGCTLFDIIKK